MHAFRVRRRLTHWIAALAVLFAALAPAVSHALSSQLGDAWVEVCTVQGAKWVDADGADPAMPGSASHVFDHCPYCSLQSQADGVPPPASTDLALPDLGTELPRAFLAAPRTLHAWLHAPSRAPPSIS